MTCVVVVADKLSECGLELLRATPGFEVISTVGRPEQLKDAMTRAHALIVRSDTQVTEDIMIAAPSLMVIARAGIGVDNIDLAAATRRGVAVLNAPGANTVSAAEHTIAMLLALLRRIPWAVESMWQGKWERKRFGGTELRGKTLGCIGMGRIGQHVARIAQAFGMKVIAHDLFLSDELMRELKIEPGSIEETLAGADVVTLHIPMTDETRHLINAERLALMKPSAVLVNTARGGLVDGAALLKALEKDQLAGAAIDVFDPEPLPEDSPLRSSSKLLLTPHLAASTAEAQERVALEICQSVRQALRAGEIGGAVNVPDISSETLSRFRPALELARALGRLAASISTGSIRSVEVQYGGEEDGAPKAVMLAAMEGVLLAQEIGPVSIVNVAVLAEQNNISTTRRVFSPEPGLLAAVGVELVSTDGQTTVRGAQLSEQTSRITRIGDFPVDIVPEGLILLLWNRDVPGVIGRVGTVLGAAKINIATYHKSRSEVGKGEALATILIDRAPSQSVMEELKSQADVLDVRLVDLK